MTRALRARIEQAVDTARGKSDIIQIQAEATALSRPGGSRRSHRMIAAALAEEGARQGVAMELEVEGMDLDGMPAGG